MKVLSLFSGAGGLDLGLQQAGFSIVQSIEIDKAACSTLRKNFQHEIINKSIVDIDSFPAADVVAGGPPCQSFSLAGKRGGVNDPRGRMLHEFIRVINTVKPKVFIMENVRGLLTADKGETFKNILKALGENHELSVLEVNAYDYGVPQNRNRIIIVGAETTVTPKKSKGGTVRDAIYDLMSVPYSEKFNHVPMRHTKRIIERFKHIKPGQSLKDVPQEHMQRKRGDPSKVSGKTFGQNNMRLEWDKPSPTVCASFQSNFVHPELHRNLTAREAARLQTFPDDFTFAGKRTNMSWDKDLSQYQQIGNAVPVNLAKTIGEAILCR